ncbi:MAG: NAD(P)H-quinone oxidoreductase [Kordiimonadaceae bacterium]|nr:NAD(P)H-quinone oxidoreductase [Kordiimonadaceae bacterium]
MQVIEILKPGGPDVLVPAQRAMPEVPSGYVLVKVRAAGVNRPDVVQRMGLYPPPPGASDIPGLEIAGVIEQVGESVEGFGVGDAVCALVTGGGYAEYCLAPVETILPIPSGLSFIEAAALPETFFTVWSNVFMRAGLVQGEAILLHGGSSGIGSTAIQLAKAFGATVYTTAGSDDKTAFCKALGADAAINYRTDDFVTCVEKLTDGKGVDVVLDMVGGDYIAKNIACLGIGGRHVSIAFLQGFNVEMNMLPVMLKRLTLTGSTLRARSLDFKAGITADLRQKVWPLLATGAIKPVVDTIFPATSAAAAHTMMEASSHMGKLVLNFGEGNALP